jgi:5'-phosphate synthase pdxT subunit
MKIGVLALQGAFIEHVKSLSRLNIDPVIVKLPRDLSGIDALIIPGGESTTISKLLAGYSLMEPLKDLVNNGLPILGTCAGTILLARDVVDSDLQTLQVMDIGVRRNAYGRQRESFEAELQIPSIGDTPFKGIFIRAPIIEYVKSDTEILCSVDNHAVAVKQGKIIACNFHPELTDDLRIHQYFLKQIRNGTVAESNNR